MAREHQARASRHPGDAAGIVPAVCAARRAARLLSAIEHRMRSNAAPPQFSPHGAGQRAHGRLVDIGKAQKLRMELVAGAERGYNRNPARNGCVDEVRFAETVSMASMI